MPSKMIVSSEEQVHFPTERQFGFWNNNNAQTKTDHYAGLPAASSSLHNLPLTQFQGINSIKYPETYLTPGTQPRTHLGNLAVGAERAAALRSSNRSTYVEDQTTKPTPNQLAHSPSYFSKGLFSSSVSELFTAKVSLSSSALSHGHSVDSAPHHYEEEEPFESLKEMEAQTIGNLLPDDDDDLLSGVTEGHHYGVQPSSGDDIEDLDLFSSVGGIELGDDASSRGRQNTIFSEETPNRHRGGFSGSPILSRTLFVKNINSNIEDTELQALFEQYGDIQTLYTATKHRGFVIISYYDLRAARGAMGALHNKPWRNRNLDIHYSIPKDNLSGKDITQGILVVFNLDSSVSNDKLYKIFGFYGEIKEIRGTSQRNNHKMIEFYDLRSAEAALRALNRTVIAGKQIKVEPSHPSLTQYFHPGLEIDELLQKGTHPKSAGPFGSVPHGAITSGIMKDGTRPFIESPFHHEISSSVPNSLPSLTRVQSVGGPFGLASSHSHGQLQFDYQGMPISHPHSLPEYHDNFPSNSPITMASNIRRRSSERIENGYFGRVIPNGNPMKLNESVFPSSGNNESCSLPMHHHYMRANSHHPRQPSMMWSNSPSHIDRFPMAHPSSQLQLPRGPTYISHPGIPINNHHHVGSAPTVYSTPWDRPRAFVGESPPQRCLIFPGRGQMLPMMSSFDSSGERTRSRRNENNPNQAENTIQYELDIERIMKGEDVRTTLMLKNIPNKYTSKMLLAALDERHRGTYDFVYLPIDFKNKCNVGYAFINMINPSVIVPFYEAFNGKKWEKFNSEKVASLAYARIQGKNALVSHFQNSSLMNEDKRCQPILFHTEGPNAGDQVPFPTGVNIRLRQGKNRTSANEESNQGSPPNQPNRESSSSGDSSTGSPRDSD